MQGTGVPSGGTGDYLALAIAMRGLAGHSGMNVVLWGPTGSGKSALVTAVARQYGLEPVEFLLGVIEPEDVGGLPVPGPAETFVRQVDPRLEEAAQPGHVLLFDDFTSAPPAVQAATLRLILEREVAGIDLSRTPIVATATPVREGGLQPVLPAVANRFLHLQVGPDDARRYLEHDYATRPDGTQVVSELDLERLEIEYAEAEDRAWKLYRRVLEGMPAERLHVVEPPAEIDGPDEAPYPSARSWEMAVLATAACWAAGLDPAPMVIGCIGKRAYDELVARVSPITRRLTPSAGRLLQLTPASGRRSAREHGDADYLAVAAAAPGLGGVSGLPVVAWGGPGSGKSSMARAVFEALGYRQRTIVLGTWMPTDLGGIPIPARDGSSFLRQVDPVLAEVAEPGWGLVVDDLTFATPAVQNAALDLVLRRRAGSVDLGRTPIIVTANPLSSGALHELTPSMANRLLHLEVDGAEAKSYLLGELRADREVRVSAERLRRHYRESLAMAEVAVAQFLHSRPGDLNRPPTGELPDGGRAYAHPTPRTWELAARALARCQAAGIPALPLLVAAIGEEMGSLLAQWDREHRLPSPSDVFAGFVDWGALRPDEALASAKAAALVAESEEEVEALLREGRRCQQAGAPDIFAPAYRVLRGRILDAKLPLEHSNGLGRAIKEMAHAVGIG